MNVAIAIWKINPQAVYLLRNSNASSWEDIIEWRGPGDKPTPGELAMAWQNYLDEQGIQEAESQYALQIQEDAEIEVSSIPGYAAWTRDEADTWYQTNIRDPFEAATTVAMLKPVLGTMITVQWVLIRMVLAMRNKLWWWMQNQP